MSQDGTHCPTMQTVQRLDTVPELYKRAKKKRRPRSCTLEVSVVMLDDIVCQLLGKALLLEGCRELEGAKPDPGVSHPAHNSPRFSLDVATAAAAMVSEISQDGSTTVLYKSKSMQSRFHFMKLQGVS